MFETITRSRRKTRAKKPLIAKISRVGERPRIDTKVSTDGLLEFPQAALRQVLAELDQSIAAIGGRRSVAIALDAAQSRVLLCLTEHLGSDILAKLFTLKMLNVWLSKYDYLTKSTTVLSRPFSLIVDPSNYCNLQCPGCVHSPTVSANFLWDRGNLAPDRFLKFLQRYGPTGTHIIFCSYGEPLLNSSTPALVRLAKTYRLSTMLSTNLSIGKLDAEAYVQSGLDFMILSIDGATQSVYEKYRRNGRIDLVYANLRKLVEAKRKLQSRTPVLQWQFLAFEHNEHEIPLAIEIARQIGVDQIHVCTPDDRSWDDPQIRASRIQPVLLQLTANSCDRTQRAGPEISAPLDCVTIHREFSTTWQSRFNAGAGEEFEKPEVTANHTCKWLYTNLTMDAIGRVMPCCGAPSASADLNFGTFESDADVEMYNSPKHRLSRLYFRDRAQYELEKSRWTEDRLPYCVNCAWNQDQPNVDTLHVAEYLSAHVEGLLDAESIRYLCSW